jgi:hypothetical protein
LDEIVKFFERITEDMEGINWHIVGLTSFIEVVENDLIYAELPNGYTYDKQDDYYLHQTQHGEDYFTGTIIYPIAKEKAVIVEYDC